MMVLAAMAALAAGRRDDLCLVAPIRSSDDSTWQFRFDIPHNTPGNVQGPNALRFTMCNGGRHVTSRMDDLPPSSYVLDARCAQGHCLTVPRCLMPSTTSRTTWCPCSAI